jgi:hypothetical protein
VCFWIEFVVKGYGMDRIRWFTTRIIKLMPAMILTLCGCEASIGPIQSVITDPNVQLAAATTVRAVVTAATLTNPELAGIIIAGSALATAAGAFYKAIKKSK